MMSHALFLLCFLAMCHYLWRMVGSFSIPVILFIACLLFGCDARASTQKWHWVHIKGIPGTLAIGDSTCQGFGPASGFDTIARVGASSGEIVKHVPNGVFDRALVCAGTNDPPGRHLQAIRERIHARSVTWLVPVNGARNHVLSIAHRWRDNVVFYTPSRRKAVWPHPDRYTRLKI